MTDETNNEQTNAPDPVEPVNVAQYQAEVQRLRNELTSVREEAASRRVELRQVREELTKAKSLEEYQELEQKYQAAETQRNHERLIAQYAKDLPDELRESVTWPEAEDDIKATATKLARFAVVEYDNSNPSGGLGPRGNDDNESFDPSQLVSNIPR